MRKTHLQTPFVLLLLIVLQLSLLTPNLSFCDWESAGKLSIPNYSYCFLATSKTGDLMAAAFNSSDLKSQPRQIPALLIKNPTSASPQVIELCSVFFQPQRGYSGLACDDDGNFYLSGDTGEALTCFVKKFKSDGSPDMSFGGSGEIVPKRRCLGVDIVGDYLLLAIDWGNVLIYNRKSGAYLGALPASAKPIFVRDIAVDPSSLRIFGVALGGVVVWEGGSPANPSLYKFRALTPQTAAQPRASEGISYDPITRAAIIIPIPGNESLEVTSDGKIKKSATISEDPKAHFCDSALSFDSNVLFISDMITMGIHVMKRTLTNEASDIKPVLKPPLTIAPTKATKNIEWNKSYTEIMDKARSNRQPMIVYFRKSNFAKCEQFEREILLSEEFKQRAQNYVCVFEDVSINPLLAYRFGVIRVPHIVILDKNGDTFARYTFNIDTNTLYSAISECAQK